MCVSSKHIFATLTLALCVSCTRQPAKPAIERIAILRFENLGSDVSADWMGRAFSEIISTELEGAPGTYSINSVSLHSVDASTGPRPITAPGISAERRLALGSGATRIGYGQFVARKDGLQARLVLEDAGTGKMSAAVSVSVGAGDVVAAASALAAKIASGTDPYGTRSAAVVKTCMGVLESGNLAGSAADLERAVAADPDFGLVYRQLAQAKMQLKDPDGAVAVLKQALGRGNSIRPVERARIQLDLTTIRPDSAARSAALAELTKAAPNNPAAWRELGALSVSRHEYQQAVAAYQRATTIIPEDPDSWNQLGYAAAYAGDVATSANALRKYQSLQPNNANPLDSLGDASLLAGRLKEAEGYYLEGAKKDPNFFGGLELLKAAMAHLMTGDAAGADAIAKQYFDARAAANDPQTEFRRAQWSWISGRRKEGYQQMEKLARASETGPMREVAAHAYAEVAVWSLMLGNRQAAAEMAQKAVTLVTASSGPPAMLARFLSQPAASAGEWQARADKLAPGPVQGPVRDFVLATALLLSKEFEAAVPVLQRMYDSGNPLAGEGLPVLLAWAEVETGHVQEAVPLLRFNPVLSTAGLGLQTPFYFPRIFYLRGVAAQKQGKADEARENFRIFRQLSGGEPLMWGEESKAR